jgi:hypothetical protein
MFTSRDAHEVLDRDFLETRCKILELAAALDRIDRAPERHRVHPDARMEQIRRSLESLLVPDAGRTETVQRVFSLDYDSRWRETFRVNEARGARSGD